MKTRILASAVLVPLLFILVFAVPTIVTAIVFGLMLAIGSFELLFGTGLVKHPRLVTYATVMAFAVTLWSYFDAVHAYAVLGILVFVMALFAEMMNDHVKVRFNMIAMTLFAGLVVPYLLSALIRILEMRIGESVIMIPFLIAFLNDAGAYFVGKAFGKRKLAPVVSPNKTIEGALGGLCAAVVGILLYCLILSREYDVNYLYAIIYAVVGAAVGVMGDLCFSIIKRQTGIKDYGHLIPGHGGILDRFDSLMTVAPLVEVLLVLMPIITE